MQTRAALLLFAWTLTNLFGHCVARKGFNDYAREQRQRKQAIVDAQRDANLESSKQNYRYYNNDTAPYFIHHFPDVHFDAGEFYSGSIPIDKSDPNRTLFFVFKPAQNGPSKDITIWLNGGPGCSSLLGFFQENGPILWEPGTFAARRNPYAWSTITNMLWVEQPVGTGFAQGKPTATNEVETAKDFVGFFKNWETLFGIKNYKIYVTGESYAGRYVPYISAEMLDQKDKNYFDLTGALTYDPVIGSYEIVQMEITAYPFVAANANIFNLNSSFMSHLEAEYKSCGHAAYVDKYLTFPPPGNQPVEYKTKCDVFGQYERAAIEVNPCWDIYHITNYCPILSDVVQGPYGPTYNTNYFNRTDVKKALHAPMDVSWSDCADHPVFVAGHGSGGPEHTGDLSPDPIQHVLPKVIEATGRVLVGNGDWDSIIITNGTLLSIQNMTWNGMLGFQKAPSNDLFVPESDKQYHTFRGKPQGTMGKWHHERGLMWVETYQSGHMQPQYQPRASLRHLEWLLGIINTF